MGNTILKNDEKMFYFCFFLFAYVFFLTSKGKTTLVSHKLYTVDVMNINKQRGF